MAELIGKDVSPELGAVTEKRLVLLFGHNAATGTNMEGSVHHTPSCPNKLTDPLARKSDIKISSRLCQGDGDVWIEKKCISKATGKYISVFYSAHTGRKVPYEPPSGAAKVLFMASHAIGICPGCYELYKLEKQLYDPLAQTQSYPKDEDLTCVCVDIRC